METKESTGELPRLIAVTGGIGCGKSVICRILKIMGYAVYNCDAEAKRIMDGNLDIIQRIEHSIDSDAVCTLPDGSKTLHRKKLAATVFNNPEKLAILNGLVHGAVKSDILRWKRELRHTATRQIAFVETAILTQSGLDRMVDEVWIVTAPENTRIQRAMLRDGATKDEICSRMARQSETESPISSVPKIHTITNDDTHPVLPQINTLLANLNQNY